MPNIFDNIDLHLLDELRSTLAEQATAADISVDYFNLRGWSKLGDLVDRFSGTDDSCCRLLIGMQRVPEELRRESQRLCRDDYLVVACGPDTPALSKAENHDELVAAALEAALQEQVTFSGQLGSLRSTRRQVFERLNRCRDAHQRRPTLFSPSFLDGLPPTLDALRRYPLKDTARTALTRQLRLGISDDGLADMMMRMYIEDRLVTITDTDDETPSDP